MPRLKRTQHEAELDIPSEPPIAPELEEKRTKLRNQWEFASFMQFIYLFGDAVKIDHDFDIEDLEAECLQEPPSDKLPSIGLALLKLVSSHRGLTPELFDEYTRRQYEAKAPHRNPFGIEEVPIAFNSLPVATRIRVLHQLSTWTFNNVDRMRSLMPNEEDHLNWRIEPLGWDAEDRAYFVLDDNRLYRRTDAPIPDLPARKSKAKAKKKGLPKTPTRGTRSSKRRKIEESEEEEDEPVDETMADVEVGNMTTGDVAAPAEDDEPAYGFTSKTWECIAVTLEDYQEFLSTIFRTRDPNEKALRARIEQDVLLIIEKQAEAIRQKQLKKIRELENLQKMATAKRSSRLADKADREEQERKEREEEARRQRDLKMALQEQERQRKIEEGHESRRLTREQRVRERESKRILHEEELARLEEDAQRAESQDPSSESGDMKRISERHLKIQKEQHQKALELLAAEEEGGKWYFDCVVCGLHGENLDDGSHSIACDRCNVWQHSKCHGFTPKQAEKEDFNFICATCRRKEEDAAKPKIPPLKLSGKTRPDDATPDSKHSDSRPTTANRNHANNAFPSSPVKQPQDHVQQPKIALSSPPQQYGQQTPDTAGKTSIFNGPNLSPNGQTPGPLGSQYPPISNFAPKPPQQPWQGTSLPLPPASQTSPGHFAQHQAAHRSAVTSAGGHLNPVLTTTAAQSPQHFTPQLPRRSPSSLPHPTTTLPSPVPLLNGFQSPIKQPRPNPSALNSSPPPPASASTAATNQKPPITSALETPGNSFGTLSNSFGTPAHAYTPKIQHEWSPQLNQSPKTALPPPKMDDAKGSQYGLSPVKSSPAGPRTTSVVTPSSAPVVGNPPALAPRGQQASNGDVTRE